MKEHFSKLIMILFLLIIFGVGISYALNLTGVFDLGKQIIQTGILKVEFTEKTNLIKLKNMTPTSDYDALNSNNNVYKFTIENTGTINAAYEISLVDEENKNTIDLSYVKCAIKKDNSSYDIKALSDVVLDKDILNKGDTSNYEIRFWLDINAPNSVMGAEFYQKLTITSIQTK